MDAVLTEPNTTQTTAIPACSTPSETKTTRKPLKHAFTSENAAEFTKKGLLVRAANRALRKAMPEKPSIAGDPYVALRLRRTREQLERIDELLKTEADPQKLDRLVSAQSRLSEQWRIFSGIPLPGSRRPGRESTSKAPSSFEPSE